MTTEFDYEGEYYLQIGLLDIWGNEKLCDKKKKWADPPVLLPDSRIWLDANCVRFGDAPVTGMPTFVFPNEELRTEFKSLFSIPEPRGK